MCVYSCVRAFDAIQAYYFFASSPALLFSPKSISVLLFMLMKVGRDVFPVRGDGWLYICSYT